MESEIVILMKKLIYIFLFVQMFTNAFAISSFITIALVISLLLFFLGVIKGYHTIDFKEPPFLSLFFFILLFGYIFIATGEKKTNHLILWVVPVLFYFFMFKRQLFKLFSLEQIKHNIIGVITCGLLTACCFAIFEFVSINIIGIELSFIPRGEVEEYTPLAMGNIRARSFMEESGQFSLYWELFAPISVYWIHHNISSNINKIVCYLIILIGLILCFSAFGFVCLLLWGASLIMYKLHHANNIRIVFSVIICAVFLTLFIIILVPDLIELFSYIIGGKLDPENSSHSDRASRFEVLKYLDAVSILTGYGPNAAGTINFESSFVSFYLGVLMNTGILGLICFCLFLFQQLKYVRKLFDSELKFAFFLSLWFSSMHLMFVDNIYVPWLWVMLALLDVIHFKEKEQKIKRIVNENFNNNCLLQ